MQGKVVDPLGLFSAPESVGVQRTTDGGVGTGAAIITITAIAAHPDDIESWCVGTLARSIHEGAADVKLLLITAGDKGSNDPNAKCRPRF